MPEVENTSQVDPKVEPPVGTEPEIPKEGESPKEEPKPKTYDEAYVKKLRDEAAGYRTKLKTVEDANKTEAEKLQEKATLADTLTPKVERYEKSIKSLVETRKAELAPEIVALMPEGDPADQLDWLEKAAKLKPANDLPPAGGRNPGNGAEATRKKELVSKFNIPGVKQ